MGSKSGGGSNQASFQASTSTYTPNPTAQANYNELLGMAENVTSRPFQPYGGQMVAGFSPDQLQAFEATRQMQGATQPYINAATNLQAQAVNFADPRNFNQQTLQQYMNPYQQDVINATMANLGQLQQQQQNRLTSQAIKQGAFGGDRTGIARAALAGQQNLANAQTLAQLQQQGYTQAMGQYNQQQQQAIQTAQNAAYGLGQLGGQAQNAALAGIQTLLGTGAQQQGLAQQQLSNAYNQWQQAQAYPYQQLAYRAGIVGGIAPNLGGTTSTVGFGTGQTQQQQPSGGGQAAGAITSLMSMLPAMFGASDEDDKTDIKYLGRDPESGEKIYSYRYKGDPKSYPKVVGPMAQDIEEDEPERVTEIGGHKVVAGLGRLKPSEREHFDGGGSAGSSAGLGALMGASPSAPSAYAAPAGNLAQQSQIDPGMGQFLQGVYDPRTAFQVARSKWVNQPQSLGDEQPTSDMFQFPKQLMQDGSENYPFFPADGEPREQGGRVERAGGGGLGSFFDLLKQTGAGGPFAAAPDNYMASAQQIGLGKIIPQAQDKARSITESAAEGMMRQLGSKTSGGGGGGGGSAPKIPELKMPKRKAAPAAETAGGEKDLGSLDHTPATQEASPTLPSEPATPQPAASPVLSGEPVGPGALEGAGAGMPFDFGAVAPPIPETHLLNPGFGFGFADGGRAELADGGVPAGGGRAVIGSGGGLGDIVLGASPSWSDLAGFGQLSTQNAAMSPDALWKGIWAKDPGEQLTPEQQGMPAMPGEKYYQTPQERLPGKLQSETQGNQNPGLDPFMLMMMGGKQGMNLGLATMIGDQVRQQQANEQQKALQEKRAKMLAEPRPVEGYFSKIGNQNINPRTGLYNLDYTGAYYGMPYQDGGRVGMAKGGAPSDLERRAMEFFISKGYPHAAAAGIVGNLVHESGGKLNPFAKGDYVRGRPTSFGVAQWHGDRIRNLQNFAARAKKDWRDFDTQLAFVNSELQSEKYRPTLEKILSARTPEQAAGHMVVGYENPAHRREGYAPSYHGYRNRVNIANRLAGGDYFAPAERAVAYHPEMRPLAYKPAEGSPIVSRDAGFAPIAEQKAPLTYANATPEQRAQMAREAEAQAAAQRNALAAASRKPGFSLANYIAPPAQAADAGVYPEGRAQGAPMPRGFAEQRVMGHERTYGPGRDTYAPGVSEYESPYTDFGKTARQGDMPGDVPYAVTMAGAPLGPWDDGRGFSEPEQPIVAKDSQAARPKQMYWGDYRDVEANPLGDFIDELAGDVRRSAKPGTATTPMGKFQGQGGLGALFDLEGYLPGDVQAPQKEKETADAGFDLGSLFG